MMYIIISSCLIELFLELAFSFLIFFWVIHFLHSFSQYSSFSQWKYLFFFLLTCDAEFDVYSILVFFFFWVLIIFMIMLIELEICSSLSLTTFLRRYYSSSQIFALILWEIKIIKTGFIDWMRDEYISENILRYMITRSSEFNIFFTQARFSMIVS